MGKTLLAFLIFTLSLARTSGISAQKTTDFLQGKWKVSDIAIEVKDTAGYFPLQKENSFLGYMMVNHIPLEFKPDGTVEVINEKSSPHFKYELTADEIKFIQVEKNNGRATLNGKALDADLATYTVYKIEQQDNRMIISRQDPYVFEKYILEK
jgi:hypothetical protein